MAQWNDTCCRLFGVAQADAEPRPISDVLPIAVLPELEHLLGTCLSTGAALTADQSFELPGGMAYFSTTLHPIKDEQERIHRIILLARDITDRKRGEEALRKAHDELERRVRERTAELTGANARLRELDRLKSEFLATMSHELRTPLNSIIGFTSLVKEGIAGPLNDEQRKQLGMVYSASKHLLGLINDLLDVSRIEAGKVSLNPEPFDFAGVVAETVAQMKPLASAKRIALRPQLPAGALPLIGDRRRCLQIMLNLVHNAVKFTEKGSIDILVKTEAQQLRIDVIDTGIGIKPELIENIFEAFRQGDSSAKRMHEGTGLGLYLCRKLLLLMNGDISVHSVPGQGSRFSFALPRHLPKDSTPSPSPGLFSSPLRK
jgi:PAS domain S-box-containing protein